MQKKDKTTTWSNNIKKKIYVLCEQMKETVINFVLALELQVIENESQLARS
jgi:hypothetical protein